MNTVDFGAALKSLAPGGRDSDREVVGPLSMVLNISSVCFFVFIFSFQCESGFWNMF